MAIYLTKMESDYLKTKLESMPDYDFIAKGLLKAIYSDDKRKEDISTCEHEPASYVGKKTCCAKCGSHYEKGMGFSWRREDVEQQKQR